MARKLPRSIVRRDDTPIDQDDEALRAARARFSSNDRDRPERGAWAQAGSSVMATELEKLQAERIANLLSGNLVIELDPQQISDEVGSDRSAPWQEDEAFATLKASIAANGQDMPVQVAPLSGQWHPVFDEADGIRTDGIAFRIIGGRRRLEALKQLGRKVRAVCVSLDADEPVFDQLHRRFRENAERENLSLLDEFLSIGEMFSHAKTLDPKLTGRAFAKTLSVGEPKLSRARALYDHRARIFAEVDAPHDLTLHELDRIIPVLRGGGALPSTAEEAEQTAARTAKPRARPVTLKRTQIIKGRKIVAKSRQGKITLDLGSEAQIDETFLDKLLLFIQQSAVSDR